MKTWYYVYERKRKTQIFDDALSMSGHHSVSNRYLAVSKQVLSEEERMRRRTGRGGENSAHKIYAIGCEWNGRGLDAPELRDLVTQSPVTDGMVSFVTFGWLSQVFLYKKHY